MIDLPPPLILPEKPALIMPAPAIIKPEYWWLANLPGMIPGAGLVAGGASAPAPVITHVASDGDEANHTSYSFASQALGAQAAGRIIIVACFSEGSTGQDRTLSSCTVEGNSATIHATEGIDYSSAGLCSVATNVGTTGTIVVGWPGGQTRCYIEVYSMVGAGSNTPVDADSAEVDEADTLAITVIGPAGVVCAASADADSQPNITGGGVTNLKEGNQQFMSGEFLGGGTFTFTVDANDDLALCAAAWEG